MKKRFPATFLFVLVSFLTSEAQQGWWTWIKGCNYTGCGATWGTLGVPDAANMPAGTYAPYWWTDTAGYFWTFGGLSAVGYYSAMWRYNSVTNEWTWMHGPNTGSPSPVYGTLGIFDAANRPGYRTFGSVCWTDNKGKFWLFGGDGYSGTMSDLWQYDPVINQWAWMAGPTSGGQSASYGVKGIPSATNTPGNRREGNATWVDSSNNLWMFGGAHNGQFKQDMWKFDVALSQWVWMAGSSSNNQPGVYGAKGVADSLNTPSSRSAYCRWQDKSGKFWLFGGGNYNTGKYYNDLWMYDPSVNWWTWVSGTSSASQKDSSGLLCDSSEFYYPSTRFENRACAMDSCGNFWLFGGIHNTSNSQVHNDLWIYRPMQNDWTYVSGELSYNLNGTYGTLGVADSSNLPGGRLGSVMWLDSQQNIYMYAGSPSWGITYFSDIWKFTPDPDCPVFNSCLTTVSSANFSASDTTLCEKFCIDYFDLSVNNPVSWQWTFDGGDPSTSPSQNPVNICYDTPGTFDVTLVTTDAFGNTDSITLSDYITVYTNPFAPSITQTGNLLTSSVAASYQWQLNNVDIPGATDQSYTFTVSGLYTVIIVDANGCQAQSSIKVVYTGIYAADGGLALSIFPNPSGGIFRLEAGSLFSGSGPITVSIRDLTGREIFASEFTLPVSEEIHLKNLAPGVYYLKALTGQHHAVRKLVVK